MEIEKRQKYLEKLYLLLGASIFVHYALVILFSILILVNIFTTGEYKKIFKDKSLITVGIVLGFSLITSAFYKNILGLMAIPIFLCVIVGRYYTLIVDVEFKKNNLEWMAKFSGISLFIGIGEFLFTHNRVGYFAYFNPNYLGSIMMMSAIINLYFTFEKRSKINFAVFIMNILTILITGSRSSLIAVILGVFVLFFYFLKRRYFAGLILMLLSYILGVISGVFPFLRESTLIEYFWLRVEIIDMAIRIFKRTNLLYGHGNFFYYKFTNYVYPHSHNALVELLLSYGLIGTIALLTVFLRYLYDILRNDRNNVLKIALIAGIVVHNFTDFAIFWVQTVLLFIMALAYKEKNEKIRGYRQIRNK